jgi:hypothetical protein
MPVATADLSLCPVQITWLSAPYREESAARNPAASPASSAEPFSPVSASTAPVPHLSAAAETQSPQKRKEPSADAFAAYRLKLVTGETQTNLARLLQEEWKRPVTQGQVSRWLNEVKDWIEAGNVLPDLTATPNTKPTPINPELIDMGERQDGRARHQRGRRNSDDHD